jgi:hypothetical protein
LFFKVDGSMVNGCLRDLLVMHDTVQWETSDHPGYPDDGGSGIRENRHRGLFLRPIIRICEDERIPRPGVDVKSRKLGSNQIVDLRSSLPTSSIVGERISLHQLQRISRASSLQARTITFSCFFQPKPARPDESA